MSDARLTNQKVLLAEGGSKPRTAQEIRAHRARERKKFENWFRRKWGGISRDVIYHGRDHFEYKESAAQTAWEVWAKFTETQL